MALVEENISLDEYLEKVFAWREIVMGESLNCSRKQFPNLIMKQKVENNVELEKQIQRAVVPIELLSFSFMYNM